MPLLSPPDLNDNRPLLSSPGPLYQNEVKCSAFDIESHANKTHFHKKCCALGLTLKVRVFRAWKWPIALTRKLGSMLLTCNNISQIETYNIAIIA